MGTTRVGRASSAPSKNSNSTPDAAREKTLKLTPPRQTVAPRGALRPVLVASSSKAFAPLTPLAPSRHRARLGVPDIGRVLGNRAVARELPGAGHVEDGLARPRFRVRIQRAQAAIGLEIGCEIGKIHVVVAARQQGVAQWRKDARLIAAEVVGEDQVQRRADLWLVIVVPPRVVPGAT